MSYERRIPIALLGLLVCACRPADNSAERQDAQVEYLDASRDAVSAQDDAAVADSTVESAQDSGTQEDANASDANASDAEVPPVDDGIPVAPNVFPLVAPSLCTTQNGRMFECRYKPGHVDALSIPGSGQFKTRVSGHVKGDCTTQFPFVPWLSAEGVERFKYNIYENDHLWLRRDDSAAIASVNIENGSAFAGKENYSASCRVWLEVEFNVPIEPSAM